MCLSSCQHLMIVNCRVLKPSIVKSTFKFINKSVDLPMYVSFISHLASHPNFFRIITFFHILQFQLPDVCFCFWFWIWLVLAAATYTCLRQSLIKIGGTCQTDSQNIWSSLKNSSSLIIRGTSRLWASKSTWKLAVTGRCLILHWSSSLISKNRFWRTNMVDTCLRLMNIL